MYDRSGRGHRGNFCLLFVCVRVSIFFVSFYNLCLVRCEPVAPERSPDRPRHTFHPAPRDRTHGRVNSHESSGRCQHPYCIPLIRYHHRVGLPMRDARNRTYDTPIASMLTSYQWTVHCTSGAHRSARLSERTRIVLHLRCAARAKQNSRHGRSPLISFHGALGGHAFHLRAPSCQHHSDRLPFSRLCQKDRSTC